jgi:hypothetical protein
LKHSLNDFFYKLDFWENFWWGVQIVVSFSISVDRNEAFKIKKARFKKQVISQTSANLNTPQKGIRKLL